VSAAGSVARLDVDVVGLVDEVRPEVPVVTDLKQKIENQFPYLTNTRLVEKFWPIHFGDGLLNQGADFGMIASELIGAMSQSRGDIDHFRQESIIRFRHLDVMVKGREEPNQSLSKGDGPGGDPVGRGCRRGSLDVTHGDAHSRSLRPDGIQGRTGFISHWLT
jgi:hypothetical protein